MITRLFLIVLSIILSGQSLDECTEENTVERAESIEILYDGLITTEVRKQRKKLLCNSSILCYPKIKTTYHFVREETSSQSLLYLQHRCLLI